MDMSESTKLAVVERPAFYLVPRTRIFFAERGLPEKAGNAALQFWDGIEVPHLEKGVISLPSRQGALVYHSLRGGHQFIAEVRERAFFGGTDDDESIFLCEVEKKTLEAFAAGGEESFYASLKPKELKALEDEYANGETLRQGDICAFWCPAFGKNVPEFLKKRFRERSGSANLAFQVFNKSKIQVFSTRHEILGGHLITLSWGEKEWDAKEQYYCGTLQAPDHKPLQLGSRPHRLFQTANLVVPKNARGYGD